MGLTPSQQSYSQRSNGGAATAAIRQDVLNQEGDGGLEDQEPMEHPLVEDRIYTSEAQERNKLLYPTGFGYGSQATTADETERGSPGQPSSEPLRSRSELFHGSRNTTRENSKTGNPDQQAMGNDHSVQSMDTEEQVGLEVGCRRSSTDNIDIGEAYKDERDGCGENGGGLGARQDELLGMPWVESWKYATTEPDTESDPSRTG
ncbi:hypothetical protein MPH_12370 [Macrophomina phaseolina MS6]|uniref:Uncharacterized protein n=1 Tax=Macrophomina phaseolina (strain MS6) TaxID=1126212 RepID=K2RC96_MACPH|nr:hypothetical protein MPH_12370 [Macrophomina phaseolina MS6]